MTFLWDLSHFLVTFESLEEGPSEVTFESLFGHFNCFGVLTVLAGKPISADFHAQRRKTPLKPPFVPLVRHLDSLGVNQIVHPSDVGGCGLTSTVCKRVVHCKRRGSEKSTFLAIFWGALIFSGSPVL